MTVDSDRADAAIDWTEAQPLYRVKADMFKGLAHPIRVRILEIVAAGGEVPVAELVDGIGLEPGTLSQHLAVLRRHGLVESDRRGSYVYYRATTPVVADLLRVAREFLVERLAHAHEQLDATGSLPSLRTPERDS